MTMPPQVPRRILPIIVLSQFAGASLWFAGNAILPDLARRTNIGADAIGGLTTAVQLGFIVGTLLFAYLSLSDRWSPRSVFTVCAVTGALCNGGTLFTGGEFTGLLALRFLTGFFLAGIYPVGMKIASGWYQQSLGRALGFLVGALVLGTALPHLISGRFAWETVIVSVSGFAILGGLAMYVFVPDGPYLRAGAKFDPRAIVTVFQSPDFRASSFGYFGHMWELYTLWAFLPVYLAAYGVLTGATVSISLWCFIIIAAGALGCVLGGLLSPVLGSARVAFFQLAASGTCCLLSPLALLLPPPMFFSFLVVWGIVVAGDSPQFSAMNARYAPNHLVGSALTIVNCIGFAITVASINVLQVLLPQLTAQYMFLLLVPGPVLGLVGLLRLARGPS